jgi:hypothetical protein
VIDEVSGAVQERKKDIFLEIEHPEEKAEATFIPRKKDLKGRLRLIFLGGT